MGKTNFRRMMMLREHDKNREPERDRLEEERDRREREIERRVRRYSQDPEQLSAGKVTKLISNITFDQLNGDIRLNEKKVAGKL